MDLANSASSLISASILEFFRFCNLSSLVPIIPIFNNDD